MHTTYAYQLLDGFPENVRRGTRLHHEKMNGSGYPDRVSEGKIPLEARVTAISDIYDAMVSRRSYKNPANPFSIIAKLTELQGSDLDPLLVTIFNQHMPLELLNKPVNMSDGSIGVVRDIEPDDPEYPLVEINGRIIKSSEHLYCTSMYTED
jgi:HD-GYP domain-containing protein (c-di-GMP phosphodiesterase class II)